MAPRTTALLALLLAAPPAAAAEHGLAARVNGAEITRERLERYFEERLGERGRHVAGIRSPEAFKALKREALDELVERELLWQEARRRKRVASAAEVEAAMARFRAAVPDPARRRLQLEAGGFTEVTYAEYVRRELSIRRIVDRDVAPKLKIADADVEAFYDANADRLLAGSGGARPPLAEVREPIRARLREERVREQVKALVAELRAKATVELLVPLGEGR